MRPEHNELIKLLRTYEYFLIEDVLDMVGMSKTTWYDGIRKRRHPRPIKFGSKSLWRKTQLKNFLVR